jgi:hypothetical protein
VRGATAGDAGNESKCSKGQQQYLFDHNFCFVEVCTWLSLGSSSERGYAAAPGRREPWGVRLAEPRA